MDRSRLGKCYQLSGRYATEHPGSVLVHGSIEGMGMPRLKHAFVLTSETHVDKTGGKQFKKWKVWEPVTNEVWELDAFCAFFSPHVDDEYTHKEVLAATLLTAHWGPWK